MPGCCCVIKKKPKKNNYLKFSRNSHFQTLLPPPSCDQSLSRAQPKRLKAKLTLLAQGRALYPQTPRPSSRPAARRRQQGSRLGSGWSRYPGLAVGASRMKPAPCSCMPNKGVIHADGFTGFNGLFGFKDLKIAASRTYPFDPDLKVIWSNTPKTAGSTIQASLADAGYLYMMKPGKRSITGVFSGRAKEFTTAYPRTTLPRRSIHGRQGSALRRSCKRAQRDPSDVRPAADRIASGE